MSYCDESTDDADELTHSAKFGHVCDEEDLHGGDHRCGCGKRWDND